MDSPAPPGGCGVATSPTAPAPITDPLRHVQILNVPRLRRGQTTVPVEVRVLGAFEEFNVHWDEARKKTRPCWGHEECPHCKADGHDVRRVAYAPAEVYEYDSTGHRSAKLVALYVPEKQIPIAKAIPINAVVKLTRVGSGPAERLKFDLVAMPGTAGDRGRVHDESFDVRAYMIRFWFKGPLPKEFRTTAPDHPVAALPGLPLTPPLPFVEAEENAADYLMRHFRTNTLAGAAAALREQLAAQAEAPKPTATAEAAEREQWGKDEIAWYDGPAAAARCRIEVTAACQRSSLAPFAKTYADEKRREKTEYLAYAAMLEAAGESKAGLLLRDVASRRFDPPASCPGKPSTDPAPRSADRPAPAAGSAFDGTRPVTSAPPMVGAGSAEATKERLIAL